MELGNNEARSVGYYYYILGSLPNAGESMELGRKGARSVGYNYYILGSLPYPYESMELGSHGARSGSLLLLHSRQSN